MSETRPDFERRETNYQKYLFKRLQLMKEEKVLTDVVFVFENKRIVGHKLVIEQFMPCIRESSSEIEIDNVNFEGLRHFLDLLYIPKITWGSKTAELVANALDFFENYALDPAQFESTVKFVSSLMTIENSLVVFRIAVGLDHKSLQKAAAHRLFCHFDSYQCTNPDMNSLLIDLRRSELIDILAIEIKEAVCGTYAAFNMTLKWVECSPKRRKPHFLYVVKKLGLLNHVSKFQLKYLRCQSLEGHQMILEALDLSENATQRTPNKPAMFHRKADDLNNLDVSEHLFHRLREMRTQKEGNLVLEIDGKEIYCHKEMMAAASPFFATMLTLDMKERREGRVEIKGTNFNTMNLIVNAIYGGEFKLDGGNIQDALLACKLYEMEILISECVDTMIQYMDCDNCIDIYLLGKNYDIEQLNEGVADFLDKNIISEKDIRHVSESDLKNFISKMNPVTQNFFLNLLNWVKTAGANNMECFRSIIENCQNEDIDTLRMTVNRTMTCRLKDIEMLISECVATIVKGMDDDHSINTKQLNEEVAHFLGKKLIPKTDLLRVSESDWITFVSETNLVTFGLCKDLLRWVATEGNNMESFCSFIENWRCRDERKLRRIANKIELFTHYRTFLDILEEKERKQTDFFDVDLYSDNYSDYSYHRSDSLSPYKSDFGGYYDDFGHYVSCNI